MKIVDVILEGSFTSFFFSSNLLFSKQFIYYENNLDQWNDSTSIDNSEVTQ